MSYSAFAEAAGPRRNASDSTDHRLNSYGAADVLREQDPADYHRVVELYSVSIKDGTMTFDQARVKLKAKVPTIPCVAGMFLYLFIQVYAVKGAGIKDVIADADLQRALRTALPFMARTLLTHPKMWQSPVGMLIRCDPEHDDVDQFFLVVGEEEHLTPEQWAMVRALLKIAGRERYEFHLPHLPSDSASAPATAPSQRSVASSEANGLISGALDSIEKKVSCPEKVALYQEMQDHLAREQYEQKIWAPIRLRVAALRDAPPPAREQQFNKLEMAKYEAETFSPDGVLRKLYSFACDGKSVTEAEFNSDLRHDPTIKANLPKVASHAVEGSAKGIPSLVEIARMPDAECAGTLRAVVAKTIREPQGPTQKISVNYFNEVLAARLQVQLALKVTGASGRDSLLRHGDFIRPNYGLVESTRQADRPYFSSCDLLVASGAVPASKPRPASGGKKD